MKLRYIIEAISDEPIRDAANSIGDLIQYINNGGFDPKSRETQTIKHFYKSQQQEIGNKQNGLLIVLYNKHSYQMIRILEIEHKNGHCLSL